MPGFVFLMIGPDILNHCKTPDKLWHKKRLIQVFIFFLQILSLQMKCYNYEQESREYQKENQYLQKLVNTMHEEQLNNNK